MRMFGANDKLHEIFWIIDEQGSRLDKVLFLNSHF